MYKVGQDNIMCRCLTTLEAHIVLKELHDGVGGRHFATNIIVIFFGCTILVANFIQSTHDFYKSYDNY
jgi:hypothetical protein